MLLHSSWKVGFHPLPCANHSNSIHVIIHFTSECYKWHQNQIFECTDSRYSYEKRIDKVLALLTCYNKTWLNHAMYPCLIQIYSETTDSIQDFSTVDILFRAIQYCCTYLCSYPWLSSSLLQLRTMATKSQNLPMINLSDSWNVHRKCTSWPLTPRWPGMIL